MAISYADNVGIGADGRKPYFHRLADRYTTFGRLRALLQNARLARSPEPLHFAFRMPRRATSTSFGAKNGNDPVAAGRHRHPNKSLVADVKLIRQRYREAAAKTIPYLQDVALGNEEGAGHSDRIRAADLLGKYGIGTQQEVELSGNPDQPIQFVIVGGQKVGF
ncbi:MAG: hypothetical protein KGI71_05415 [Patescibacteria group bacterium]|nr:hypothetical protein [Patescibacteria group bacterium]